MEKTSSYTYFGIQSNGKIDKGLVANEKGIFNPEEITRILDIQAFSSWAYGDRRVDGSKYLFSAWSAEKSKIGRLDVEAQCRDTIKNLKNKVPQLKQIKQQYDVSFFLMIVPSIYQEEQPWISFNEEVIEFCYLTGTTIEVDMYIHQLGDEHENFL
ncbi:DUF4279 domain-containing protein [Planococcus sp. CP5-4]|uniref:DUF4279 domain-containing protein n=1 Tax=unclassified Planococcus (in: firmicutes) TaxID=2662419 RepID=UPI001C21B418|nr:MULTISPECIES: DUF4279 domain-containing protein [unclassified Planococcus (in: firmicutes)]MBU9675024.1 DUF4279 domain-containing protein [Planococcus sp. CP5-4_YE]MBV0910374.1 DUF4279 domain-containing protein [Planococcus sp. CP5-4_UN]MBW6063850.1 DUF4279 domain-containing protein [Planococcus sp. CP5-4]